MKIILENPNEQLIGPITCPLCKCKFKYTKDEVTRCVLDNGWDVDVYCHISCPNCSADVNI